MDCVGWSSIWVVQPEAIPLTLVPKDEILKVEVWFLNEDIGFVRQGQPVKIAVK